MRIRKFIRAESNHGSKYFIDIYKAFKYFNRCIAERRGVELWSVVITEHQGNTVGEQRLLKFAFFD